MYKILVCCSAGLTASMLVNSMRKEAQNQNKDVMIWTAAQTAARHSVAEADCILVAPQVASSVTELKGFVNEKVPVAVIDSQDFSNMDGKAVLQYAFSLLDK